MAQLHHDYPSFKDLLTEILVIVPNGPKTIARYVEENAIPYPILSDKGAKVAAQYRINTRHIGLFEFFTPSVFLVDRTGHIHYANYSTSYIKEPDNQEPLAILARLRK